MLETLAAGVHGWASVGHSKAAITGSLSPEMRGSLAMSHALAIAYNALRRNWSDVGMHIAGLVVTFSDNRAAHAGIALYDGAAAEDHWRSRWQK